MTLYDALTGAQTTQFLAAVRDGRAPVYLPGPALDARVAAAFGLPVAAYSTDLTAAWLVVEALAAQGWETALTRWVTDAPTVSAYLEYNDPPTERLLCHVTCTVTDPMLGACALCCAALHTHTLRSQL